MVYKVPKPTAKGIRQLHQKLVQQWTDRINIDEEFRDIVHQKNAIEILPDSDDKNMAPIEIHSGRGGGIIDHGVGLLMATPTVHAEPINLTTEAAREAEQVEKGLASLFQQQLIANDFWPASGRDILIYGRSFIKSTILSSVWTAQEGYPVRKTEETAKKYLDRVKEWKETEAKFPYTITHIPTLTILPFLDNNDNVLATIEEKWVTAKILAEEMGSKKVQELLDRHSLDWYDELPVLEYTDTCWVAYVLAGTEPRQRTIDESTLLFEHIGSEGKYEMLRTWEHGFGVHPITLIPGIRTEQQDYESHFKSFLADAKDALELYDFLLSRLATMVYAYYLPSYVWKLGATSAQFAGREEPTMTVNLGGVTPLYSDQSLEVLPIPQQLPDAVMLIQQVDDIIQRHTLEDVLFGRVPGAAPAFQVHLRINVARSKLTPISSNMAIGLTNVFKCFLRGIEALGEDVIVGGEKITPAMAKKYRDRVTVSIQPKSLVGRNQEIGVAMQALQFGLPWDWIVENIMDIEDPATLRLQRDIAEIEQLPPVKEKLMAEALDQLELLIEEDEFEDAEGIDLSDLPPEFAQALQGLTGQAGPGNPEGDIQALIAGLATGGPGTGPGLGRGPYPEGSAPQTIQGGRGLLTPKQQPEPSDTLVDSRQLGLSGGEMTG